MYTWMYTSQESIHVHVLDVGCSFQAKLRIIFQNFILLVVRTRMAIVLAWNECNRLEQSWNEPNLIGLVK